MVRLIKPSALLIVLLIALPLCLLLAIGTGPAELSPSDIFAALWQENNQSSLIVQQIRIPRALLALSVGGILAICGTAMQGLFRNPLADPSLIGVSGGALAGASFAIVLGEGLLVSHGIGSLSLVAFAAFLGGEGRRARLASYRVCIGE